MRKNMPTTYCAVERAVYKANSMTAAFALPAIVRCSAMIIKSGLLKVQ